jgi:hypothetical protein
MNENHILGKHFFLSSLETALAAQVQTFDPAIPSHVASVALH